ncbi:MAG: hypothetical protein IPL51_00560 [Candidatus Competibacteraceae bacterium]|nr:hypothetical protein [Candidatus Competibacteraceae bacterium]
MRLCPRACGANPKRPLGQAPERRLKRPLGQARCDDPAEDGRQEAGRFAAVGGNTDLEDNK